MLYRLISGNLWNFVLGLPHRPVYSEVPAEKEEKGTRTVTHPGPSSEGAGTAKSAYGRRRQLCFQTPTQAQAIGDRRRGVNPHGDRDRGAALGGG